MDIVYLDNSSIDRIKWDECVNNAYNGNIYACSWYLDIVCDNWSALLTKDYSYVFPLTWRKKANIRYLYQPPFAQQLGVFSRNIVSKDILDAFLNAIPEDFKLVEINLNKFNKEIPDNFSKLENATYELDLISTYDEIKKDYSENTSRNIKKALKNDIFLTKDVMPETMISIFKNNRGRAIETLKNNEYNVLLKLISYCKINNCGETWGAYNNNELCAAAFFIEFKGKAIFLFSALSDEGRRLSAMFLIVDNFIKINAGKPLVLDFEGSNNEKIAHFYKGFGSKKYSYIHINSNKLPYLVNLFRVFYKRLKFN